MSSIEDIVIDIVAGQFRLKRNEVNLNTKFVDDLGADSLDLVDLVMTIEEEFKIDIPEDKAEMFRNIQDVVEYIQEHKNK